MITPAHQIMFRWSGQGGWNRPGRWHAGKK